MNEALHLEKPDYITYIKSENPPDPRPIFKRSGGRCLYNYVHERKTCLNYRPSETGDNCRHLERILGIVCLWRENE